MHTTDNRERFLVTRDPPIVVTMDIDVLMQNVFVPQKYFRAQVADWRVAYKLPNEFT